MEREVDDELDDDLENEGDDEELDEDEEGDSEEDDSEEDDSEEDDSEEGDSEEDDSEEAGTEGEGRGRRRRPRKERPAGARTPRPIVAVVGRPNVGKSTLFNRLARANIAIVENRAGVTRDRHYADAEALGVKYVLVDTGGFDPESDDPMQEGIARQVRLALEEADVVLCVLDGTQEPLSADREAVKLLRRAAKPVLFIANKCDSPRKAEEANQLYELGLDGFFPVSALHGHGIGDLESALAAKLPEPKPIEESGYEDAAHIAIIGRPNAGKSSLVNRLLGEDRQLVDSRPGTTVDTIDTLLEKGDRKYVLVDTAGIRRKRAKKETIEEMSILAAVRAVERCDVVVLMIDGEGGVAEQDAKICGIAVERGRALLIVLNKSDLLTREQIDKATTRTREVLNFATWAPVLTTSTLTGRGTSKLLERIDQVVDKFRQRVSTAQLNKFFEQVLAAHPPPPQSGHSVRLYYLTQAQTEPPTFVAMTNHPEYIHFSYKRYVQNQIRKRFDFDGVPVRVVYRKKKNKRPNTVRER